MKKRKRDKFIPPAAICLAKNVKKIVPHKTESSTDQSIKGRSSGGKLKGLQ